jgi:transmembrane sensor
MKNLEYILNLITGNIAPDRKKEVFSIIKESSENEELYRKAKITWALMSSTQKMPDYEIEKSYLRLNARISTKHGFQKILSTYVRYAAVFVLLVGFSAIMFYLGRRGDHNLVSELKYTSVVAEKGQISKVILPDSSIVWINSGTTLTYDNNFSQDNRNLSLKGQAFFEVKKNKHLPLIVTSGDLHVKVLGTRFDVKAYPDDDEIKVTLESGKVELLSAKDKSFAYKMIPGQMASYNLQSSEVKMETVVTQDYSSWKTGKLIFIDTPMAEVIKSLKRKFDVEIEVGNTSVYRSVFNANFKNESMKEILDYIQFSCHLNYTIILEKNGTKIKLY